MPYLALRLPSPWGPLPQFTQLFSMHPNGRPPLVRPASKQSWYDTHSTCTHRFSRHNERRPLHWSSDKQSTARHWPASHTATPSQSLLSWHSMSSHWPTSLHCWPSAQSSLPRHCSSAHSKLRHKLPPQSAAVVHCTHWNCGVQMGVAPPQPALVCGEHRLHAPLMHTRGTTLSIVHARPATVNAPRPSSGPRRLHRQGSYLGHSENKTAQALGHAVVQCQTAHIQITFAIVCAGRQNPILGSQTGLP